MTEQEIISCLKENRKKGVAFAFMPSEVQEWCAKHFSERIFYIVDEGKWGCKETSIMCSPDSLYCLDADYEPEPQFKPHYEEFDVNENGFFHIMKGSDLIYYHWFNWQRFIEENFDNYNNFGGWLYDKLWSTNVLIMTDIDKREMSEYSGKDKTVVPVTPTKIKFWRYRE